MKILLGVTGGIAAYKTPELVRLFRKHHVEIKVVCTQHALELVSKAALETVSLNPVFTKMFTHRSHERVEHIELAQWPNAVLVAPATANIMGKMAHGLADDLLSTLLLATPAPVWIAPGMNTYMWEHPATQANLKILQARGVRVIGPESGELACRTTGIGRMSEPTTIVHTIVSSLQRESPWRGRTVLVSAGATREYIDPVRFISNPSTGRMGAAIANAAYQLGARVILIHGHMEVPIPIGVESVYAATAENMRQAIVSIANESDVVIMTAAVGDFRPEILATEKIKKESVGSHWTLSLVRTPDILFELSKARETFTKRPILVGFAAETAMGNSERLLQLAHHKLSAKGIDALFANDVSQPDAGFSVSTNQGVLVFSDQTAHVVPVGSKDQVALSLLSKLSEKFFSDASAENTSAPSFLRP